MASDDCMFDKSKPKDDASELNPPPTDDDSSSGASDVDVV